MIRCLLETLSAPRGGLRGKGNRVEEGNQPLKKQECEIIKTDSSENEQKWFPEILNNNDTFNLFRQIIIFIINAQFEIKYKQMFHKKKLGLNILDLFYGFV